MVKPLVSIGIPTYNRPLGLHRALTSITAQTYPHFEVIVSDNCSPGTETQEVVARFMEQDKRIRYVRQPSNIGMFNNFKFVFEAAQGEYFAWLADDDIRDETFLEKCLDVFEQPNQSSELLLVNAYSQLISHDLNTDPHRSIASPHDDASRPQQSMQVATKSVVQQQSTLSAPTDVEQPQNTDQGCTTLGLPPSERYYRYLSSVYTTQSAIGDLIHGVMKRETLEPVLMAQKNILGWDRVFLSALALEGEFYTIPEVLMYSSDGGMSTLKNAKKMADVQGIQNPFYIRKAKWMRMFSLQQSAWRSRKLSPFAKLRLSLWLWMDMMTRTVSKQAGQ